MHFATCRLDVHLLLVFLLLFRRWRLFRQPIIAHPKSAIAYTKAAVALHNFLRCTESTVYCPTGYVDGEDGEGNVIRGTWRDGAEAATGMTPVGMTSSNRYMYFFFRV